MAAEPHSPRPSPPPSPPYAPGRRPIHSTASMSTDGAGRWAALSFQIDVALGALLAAGLFSLWHRRCRAGSTQVDASAVDVVTVPYGHAYGGMAPVGVHGIPELCRMDSNLGELEIVDADTEGALQPADGDAAPSDALCASAVQGEARPARNRRRGTRLPATDPMEDFLEEQNVRPSAAAAAAGMSRARGRSARLRRPHQRSSAWDSDLEDELNELDLDLDDGPVKPHQTGR